MNILLQIINCCRPLSLFNFTPVVVSLSGMMRDSCRDVFSWHVCPSHGT